MRSHEIARKPPNQPNNIYREHRNDKRERVERKGTQKKRETILGNKKPNKKNGKRKIKTLHVLPALSNYKRI